MGGEWSTSRLGRTLLPGIGSSVPVRQEAEWASELVLTQRLEEKSLVSVGDQTPVARSSSLQSDPTLTELPQLLHTPCILVYCGDYWQQSDLIPFSQEPTNKFYTELDKSNPHNPTPFI
jgi:hypothetical protein